ncbi:MAG: insulinase family protein [Polyangiaceae bacterium]|nr:insulinase family protein [Polyangiaceae bacterium]
MTIERLEVAGTPLVVERDPRIPLVSMSFMFRTGGASDPQGKDGLLRLMLRGLRRGSGSRDAMAFEAAVDALGGEMSAEVFTSSCGVHAQVISRNLEPFMELLGQMLGAPRFPEEDVRRLRQESIAEIVDARDSDRELANLALRRGLFGAHPFGRLAAGRVSTLEKLGRDDLVAAHQAHVRASNMVVGFAGDITVDVAERITAKLIAGLPAGPAPDSALPEPVQPKGRRLFFVDKPERSQTQVLVGRLGTHARDVDHFPLVVANAAFGGTFTARLMREVRSKRGWSYGAYARLALERARHSFSMWTFPAAESAAECLALELQLLGAFYKDGITEEERSFFGKYLSRSFAFDIDTAQKRIGQALDVDTLDLPADFYSSYRAHLDAVTREQANEAVRQRLSPDDLVIAVVGTQATLLDAVQKAIPDLAETTIVPFDAD